MINKTELRIGNKVLANNGIATVIGLGVERFSIDGWTGSISYTKAEPIPLSPEILEACGFTKETGDYFKDSVVYSNKIRLYQHDNNDYSLYGFNECKVWVFYLHELQNLFASITGSELIVNLDKVRA